MKLRIVLMQMHILQHGMIALSPIDHWDCTLDDWQEVWNVAYKQHYSTISGESNIRVQLYLFLKTEPVSDYTEKDGWLK